MFVVANNKKELSEEFRFDVFMQQRLRKYNSVRQEVLHQNTVFVTSGCNHAHCIDERLVTNFFTVS